MSFFENLIKNKEGKNINEEMKLLEEGNLLSKSSLTFLNKKIKDFYLNGELEDYEKKYLFNQIEFHKKLKEIKDNYEKNKSKLSDLSINKINKRYNEINGTPISQTELQLLKKQINNEADKVNDTILNNSYRDFIETNININWSSETFYEKGEVKLFYKEFTRLYLNLLNKKYTEVNLLKIHKNNKSGLIISESYIEKILYKIFYINQYKLKNFHNDLIIRFGGQNKKFLVNKIKNKVIYNKQEEEDKIKKENDINFKIKKINNIIKKGDIYTYEGKIFILEALEDNLITKDWLLNESEKIPGFNYIDFMNNFGLTEEISKTYIKLFSEKTISTRVVIEGKTIIISKDFIEKNKKSIINNFLIFNKIIVGIESEGINQDNNNGSGAKGYFQYHTNNGKTNRKKQEYDSFETALRRNYRYYSNINPNEIGKTYLKEHKNVPKRITEAYNDGHYDPKELSAINQNKLFIIDIFNNGKKISNGNRQKNGVNDYLGLISIGNLWSVEKFYKLYHHTAPDRATKKRMKFYINKYKNEFENLV